MQEAIQKITQAKALIDNGMCRIGPKLEAASKLDAWMTAAAGRSIALADAVAQLCRHDHANEALPLVRHLAEIAVGMRWLAAGDSEARAAKLSGERAKEGWEALWPSSRLLLRAKEAGFPREDASAALEFVRDFVTGGGRAGLPWSHVFATGDRPGASPEAVFALTVRLMSHVVRALDARWEGSFSGADDLLK